MHICGHFCVISALEGTYEKYPLGCRCRGSGTQALNIVDHLGWPDTEVPSQHTMEHVKHLSSCPSPLWSHRPDRRKEFALPHPGTLPE